MSSPHLDRQQDTGWQLKTLQNMLHHWHRRLLTSPLPTVFWFVGNTTSRRKNYHLLRNDRRQPVQLLWFVYFSHTLTGMKYIFILCPLDTRRKETRSLNASSSSIASLSSVIVEQSGTAAQRTREKGYAMIVSIVFFRKTEGRVGEKCIRCTDKFRFTW